MYKENKKNKDVSKESRLPILIARKLIENIGIDNLLIQHTISNLFVSLNLTFSNTVKGFGIIFRKRDKPLEKFKTFIYETR